MLPSSVLMARNPFRHHPDYGQGRQNACAVNVVRCSQASQQPPAPAQSWRASFVVRNSTEAAGARPTRAGPVLGPRRRKTGSVLRTARLPSRLLHFVVSASRWGCILDPSSLMQGSAGRAPHLEHGLSSRWSRFRPFERHGIYYSFRVPFPHAEPLERRSVKPRASF